MPVTLFSHVLTDSSRLNVNMHLLISLVQKTDSVFLKINKNSEMQTQNMMQ